jgi:hypothetical protein
MKIEICKQDTQELLKIIYFCEKVIQYYCKAAVSGYLDIPHEEWEEELVTPLAVIGGLSLALTPDFRSQTYQLMPWGILAALGFIKYHGMTAEQFIWAWIKSEFLLPRKLLFGASNTYYDLCKGGINLD